MKTSSKMLFFTMTIISTIMVVSSSSWMNMWIGMEINLMSFIPLIPSPKNMFMSQSTMMYFLIQSMASMLFMVFILLNKYIFSYIHEQMTMTLILVTMMMKLGMPPFHMWFPEMMLKMKWTTCFMLMTWQKIAPMYVTMMVTEMSMIMTLIISLSAIMGAVGGLNQTSTQKIMAYSSMNHMSWMITCAIMYKKSWMIYMLMYTMMMMLLSMLMYYYNIMHINQMNLFAMNNMDKIIIVMMMMSMGGMPPFIGFLPKWITIQYMISSKEFMMMMVMVSSSLITLSYYLRMTSSMNLMMNQSQKWMNIFLTKKSLLNVMIMMNLTLPILMLTFNLY